MIDPKELRIGNFIQPLPLVNKNAKWHTIAAIYNDCVYVSDYKSESVNCELLEPIPLTEEWLLKFGFEINTTGSEGEFWNAAQLKTDKDFIIAKRKGYWSWTPIWYLLGKPIAFVHKLQNLYFALTGKELEIK